MVMSDQSFPVVPSVSCHVPSESPAGWMGQAAVPREKYTELLTRVALMPSITSREVGQEDAVLVRDLFAREVLEQDASGRLSIRVRLFAEWLRANSIGNVQ